jgi:hypothetical protein
LGSQRGLLCITRDDRRKADDTRKVDDTRKEDDTSKAKTNSLDVIWSQIEGNARKATEEVHNKTAKQVAQKEEEVRKAKMEALADKEKNENADGGGC